MPTSKTLLGLITIFLILVIINVFFIISVSYKRLNASAYELLDESYPGSTESQVTR